MAKNKNQNRQPQRDQQQRDQRREPGMESQEPSRGGSDERTMPSGPQVTHKQQKRFGHN